MKLVVVEVDIIEVWHLGHLQVRDVASLEVNDGNVRCVAINLHNTR